MCLHKKSKRIKPGDIIMGRDKYVAHNGYIGDDKPDKEMAVIERNKYNEGAVAKVTRAKKGLIPFDDYSFENKNKKKGVKPFLEIKDNEDAYIQIGDKFYKPVPRRKLSKHDLEKVRSACYDNPRVKAENIQKVGS